ncbi:MAG: hypothetical protein HOO86_15915 [Bacteroidales bacterium]|nr:hypothetical protein [Bacteroidales bacterium]
MKKLTLLVIMVFSMGAIFAQGPIGKGGKNINFGTGFSTYGLPIYFGMDFGVHQDITVGFNISYRIADERKDPLGLSVNGNYHFNTLFEIPRNWDLYAGLNAGFIVWMGEDDSHTDYQGLGLDLQIGGRYYWSDWGINLELGGGSGYSGGKIGLSHIL